MLLLVSHCRVGLGFLLLAVYFFKQSMAKYNEDLCNKYTNNGANDLDRKPYFFDNFEAITEIRSYTAEGTGQGESLWRTMQYSDTFKQVKVTQKGEGGDLRFYVDEKSNACISHVYGFTYCESNIKRCSSVQKEIDILSLNDGRVSLTESGKYLWWPESVEKGTNMGPSQVRGIQSKKYVTCAYDDKNDLTTVTEWHVLDTSKYEDVDPMQEIVLMACHHISQDQVPVQSKRIDYFFYRKLSLSDFPHGLQPDKHYCRASNIKSKNEMPEPPLRYSVLEEVLNPRMRNLVSQRTEYNSMSRALKTTFYSASDDNNEKMISYSYLDFSTKHDYFAVETTGNCTVGNNFQQNMPSPSSMWVFKNFGGSPLEPEIIRDIPCKSWITQKTVNNKLHISTLYLATRDWLKDQGMDENEFYPVYAMHDGPEGSLFTSYFEFRRNPGYHFPHIASCFKEETNIDAKVTLLKQYDYVEHHRILVEYEFRTLVKEISGIVSSVRVSSIEFSESDKPDETDVHFSIYGDAKGFERSNEAYYSSDPVTSQEAFDKFKAAVNNGSVQFRLGPQKLTLQFKKGSIRRVNPALTILSCGHSAGSMAAVGMSMTLLGAALGVGLIYGYRGYKQGSLPALSFSFGKEDIH